ncbi:MAG TPA: ABC transporter substrate-binding protein [Chloroflexota bacterium]|jgi:ABC-type nitrate/sulfonate/bicarbonate transport system substrate-binding protein
MGKRHGIGRWVAALTLLLAACTSSAAPSAPAPAKLPATSAPAAQAPAAQAPAQPAAAAASPAAQAPAAPSAPAAPVKVEAAYSAPSGAQMVILLAEHAGLFRERGLDVNLTLLQGERAIQSLVAGQVAFATIPGGQLVNAAVGGAPVVAVAQEMDTVGMAIHASPSVRDVAGLRGKRIGITVSGTLTDLVARVIARQAGLHVGDDVVLVNVGSVADLPPALSAGAVDAAVLSMPASLQADRLGFPAVVDVATLGPLAAIIHTALASRRPYLDEQPDAARRFVDAYAAAVRRAREDPATAQAALTKWLQIDDPALAEATYQAYVRILKDPPVTDPAAWRALLDVMAEVPDMNPAVPTTDPASLVDARFVPR